jgi:hypothetical protein
VLTGLAIESSSTIWNKKKLLTNPTFHIVFPALQNTSWLDGNSLFKNVSSALLKIKNKQKIAGNYN